MITICINCYNDMPLLKGCIESVYNQVDRIIVVDGRYRDFPGNKQSWYSTDGTIEYLHSLDKVELLFGAELFEADKRNIYMADLNEGDTVLVLDGDEVVKGIIEELDKNIDIGLVVLGSPKYGRVATRFFRYRKDLRHEGIHFILTIDGKWFNNRRHAVNGFTEKKIQSFMIEHLGRQRSKEREFQKKQYKKVARMRESQYKIASYE